MRLSGYGFTDMKLTYFVVQFEGSEIGEFIARVRELGVEGIKKLAREVFKRDVSAVSLAFGTHDFKGEVLDLCYLRVELDDGTEYTLEIYRESLRLVSNDELMETRERFIELARKLVPSIRLPKHMMFGF